MKKEMRLYILCGLPGSGKSTWAKRMVDSGQCLCVSRDAIRTMVGAGKYMYDVTLEPFIKSISTYAVKELIGFQDVVIDETNLTREKRLAFVSLARTLDAKPIIVHFTETEKCLDNRMKGDARGYTREKWKSVIDGMKESFEPPTSDECETITVNPFAGDGVG